MEHLIAIEHNNGIRQFIFSFHSQYNQAFLNTQRLKYSIFSELEYQSRHFLQVKRQSSKLVFWPELVLSYPSILRRLFWQ